jgi:HD-GYP domain-containing protein (c-di-GMP phosphodiesterase class II)
LLFVSKEMPGDEYSLEELQELEGVLHAAGRGLTRRAASPAVAAPAAPPAGVPPPPARPVQERATALVASPELLEVPEALEIESPGGEFVVAEPERPAPIHVEDPPDMGAGRFGGSAEATRALRRSLAQMRDILSLSQDFDAAFGTSKLLEVLVLSVVSVARVETVFYFSARDGDYRLTHQRGMSPDAVQSLRLRGDSSLVQRGLASSRGVCIADEARITEEERIWARQHGLRWAVPFRFKDETLGLLLLGESAGEAPPDLDMLALLLAQAGLAFDRARLYETLQDRTLGVVRGLITLIEARNGFDCGSTEQVVRYTQALARELQFPADSLRDLVYGAVLRDVGMLKVSESLLRSPADLSGDQWESIRRHPQEGASIMRQMRFNPLAVDVVLHHHEAYNGEGYPLGLRGRTIPLGARIVAVAESYVKMTMDRPYRKALGKAEALESLAENWGLRYDPLVVDALVRVVNRELSIGLKGDRDLARDLFGV